VSSCPRGAAVGGAAAQRVVRLAGTDRPAFVEVATRPWAAGAGLDPAVYEVRLANGRAVRVGPDFDPATLRRLLAIVDANDIGHAADRVC
jgi:hypothetical protein